MNAEATPPTGQRRADNPPAIPERPEDALRLLRGGDANAELNNSHALSIAFLITFLYFTKCNHIYIYMTIL